MYNKYSHNLLFGKVGFYEIKTAGKNHSPLLQAQ